MSASVLLALFWCVLANFIGMLPSKHKHWPSAYVLMTIGLPILAWAYLSDGWIYGVAFTLAAMSILRWPVVYLFRWIRARAFGPAETKG